MALFSCCCGPSGPCAFSSFTFWLRQNCFTVYEQSNAGFIGYSCKYFRRCRTTYERPAWSPPTSFVCDDYWDFPTNKLNHVLISGVEPSGSPRNAAFIGGSPYDPIFGPSVVSISSSVPFSTLQSGEPSTYTIVWDCGNGFILTYALSDPITIDDIYQGLDAMSATVNFAAVTPNNTCAGFQYAPDGLLALSPEASSSVHDFFSGVVPVAGGCAVVCGEFRTVGSEVAPRLRAASGAPGPWASFELGFEVNIAGRYQTLSFPELNGVAAVAKASFTGPSRRHIYGPVSAGNGPCQSYDGSGCAGTFTTVGNPFGASTQILTADGRRTWTRHECA